MDLDDKYQVLVPFKWDTLSIVITTLVLIVLIVSFYPLYNNKLHTWVYLVIIGTIGIFIYFITQSPRVFILTPDQIYVKKVIGQISIPLKEIINIRILTKKDTKSSYWKWGSGGFLDTLVYLIILNWVIIICMQQKGII
ncbi:MAG: hypothetical protein LUG96_12880 [Tannerellaceae bacterium]|nr:hypothetical protein [Tannerellaceae bacterium]